MTDETLNPTREGAEARLVARAQGDPAFRALLLNDPRQAIQDEFGIALPDGITIQALEETPTRYYVVLPSIAEVKDAELDEMELEAVAGGAQQVKSRGGGAGYA